MRYLIVLLLAGCASQPQTQYRWTHQSGYYDRGLYLRDFGGCEAQALGSHPGLSNERGVRILLACMQSKGWTLEEI